MSVTLRRIQEDILNSDASLPTILREAKVLAYRLSVPEFKQWVDNELDGYSGTDVELPDYRSFSALNYGNFLGPGMHIKNSPIPTENLPDWIQNHVDRIELRQGVAALEDLSYNENLAVQLPWLPDLIAYLGDIGRIRPDCALQSAWQLLSKAQVDGVLDTIRNRLLTFILELEEQYPELAESEGSFENIPAEQAGAMFQSVVIHGGQNVVGGGSQNIYNEQPSLSPQDLGALLDYVRGLNGVDEDDVVELQEALEQDEEPSAANNLGSRVNAWLGKIATKSVEGASGGVAGQGVQYAAKAIAQYYGLPVGS